MAYIVDGKKVEICLGDLKGSWLRAIFHTAADVSQDAIDKAKQDKGKVFLMQSGRKGYFLPSNQPIYFAGPFPTPEGDWEWRMKGFFRREKPLKVLRDVALHLEDLYNNAPYNPKDYIVPYVLDPDTGFMKDAIDARMKPAVDGQEPELERNPVVIPVKESNQF